MKNATTKEPEIELPTIDLLNPGSGKVGTTVSIQGRHFGEHVEGDDTYVSCNGIQVKAMSWTDELVRFVVPSEPGPGDVFVVLKGMRGNGVHFEVEA